MPIIAAVDQSERAKLVIAQAGELADLYGVELHVVHVKEFSVGNLQTESTQDATDVEDVNREAKDIANKLGSKVINEESFEPVGLVGSPPEEIIEYSKKHDAEYIVVSGRKQSPVGKALFGSVTQSILLDAERPVVSVLRDEN